MKKFILSIIAIFIVGTILLFNSNNIIKGVKRIGSEQYYVKIPTTPPSNINESYWRYAYLIEGYTERGQKKTLSFLSNRILRPHAYLRVYVQKDNEVVSWEEVQPQNIPPDTHQKLD